ncbi:AI-2E family transporter [uncultured Fibrobacter sp.]|uniref:AI-2E family transporter n=1 Tax=uncultured Fibrobacter sp. TaxID=261512 RepID=UPI002639B16E|nr:AI-2E family transporter [uncultured Fibrobacter sp.]
MTRYWSLDRIMRFLRLLIIATICIALVYYLRGVLFPFFAAFLMAYIMDPVVNKLQRRVKHRIVAVIIVLLALGLIIGGGLRLFVPMVVSEVRNLGVLIAKVFNDSEWASRIETLMPGGLYETIHSLISWDQLAASMQHLDFWREVQNIAGKVLPGAWGVLSYTGTVVLWFSGAAIIFMYLVFIMLDMPKLRRGVFSLIPDKYADGAISFAKETDRFMGTYFRAQSLVALTVGVLYAIGFGVMGLPMGVAFGLFSGSLNMIPYLQLTTIPLALVLAVVHALNTGMPFWEVALIICSIYLVVQVIQDFFLVPRIVGGSMNLPPVGILLSLSVWGKLLGFLGLLVAIPFTCLCLVYIRKLQVNGLNEHDELPGPPPEA